LLSQNRMFELAIVVEEADTEQTASPAPPANRIHAFDRCTHRRRG
jgi:hypothetical protein